MERDLPYSQRASSPIPPPTGLGLLCCPGADPAFPCAAAGGGVQGSSPILMTSEPDLPPASSADGRGEKGTSPKPMLL